MLNTQEHPSVEDIPWFPETPPRLRACFASRQVSRPVGPCGDNVVDRQLDDAAVFQVAGSWGGGVDQGDTYEHPTVVAGAQNGVEGAVLVNVSGVDVSRFINCHDAIMAWSTGPVMPVHGSP